VNLRWSAAAYAAPEHTKALNLRTGIISIATIYTLAEEIIMFRIEYFFCHSERNLGKGRLSYNYEILALV